MRITFKSDKIVNDTNHTVRTTKNLRDDQKCQRRDYRSVRLKSRGSQHQVVLGMMDVKSTSWRTAFKEKTGRGEGRIRDHRTQNSRDVQNKRITFVLSRSQTEKEMIIHLSELDKIVKRVTNTSANCLSSSSWRRIECSIFRGDTCFTNLQNTCFNLRGNPAVTS